MSMRLEGLSRYLRMQKMLERGTGATVAEMIEALGISKPTIYRYLKRLADDGFALTNDDVLVTGAKRHRIVPAISGKKDSSPFRLAKDELIALHFIRGYTRFFKGTELAEDIDNVFEKISAALDPQFYKLLKRVRGLFIPTLKFSKDYTTEATQETINELTDAILAGFTCEAVYHSFSDGRVKKLRIDPLHFFEHNGGMYLFAQMTDFGDIRMFAVERFQSVAQTEEHFEYPEGFDPEERLGAAFTIFDEEPTTFKIRFTAEQAKYIEERIWAKGQMIAKNLDGSIILSMTTSGRWDVLRWVLGYGANAELLEPEDLRMEIAETLRSTLRPYGGGKS